MTWGVWLRPPTALLAGWLADRFSARFLAMTSFWGLVAIHCATVVLVLVGPPVAGVHLLLLAVQLFGASALLYGLRALYFALLSESGVPEQRTGTAVGIVSVMGFAPDFFFPALAGVLIDRAGSPREGYAAFFLLLLVFSAMGWLGAFFLRTRARLPSRKPWDD
jgi:nitrate/nitrite transporter NarK